MNDFAVKTREDLTAALDFLARYTGDPVGFVKAAFDWENDPTLKGKAPQKWQLDILQGIKDKLPVSKTALRFAVASGHGIGKSALVAWLVLWGLCTYPDSRIVVTANTDTQLKSKTWPEVQKWYNKFILKDLFECTATTLSVRESAHAKTWQAAAIPWSKENSEAFAGLHNQGKRIILIFDEGSAIDNVIWQIKIHRLYGALSEIRHEIQGGFMSASINTVIYGSAGRLTAAMWIFPIRNSFSNGLIPTGWTATLSGFVYWVSFRTAQNISSFRARLLKMQRSGP